MLIKYSKFNKICNNNLYFKNNSFYSNHIKLIYNFNNKLNLSFNKFSNKKYFDDHSDRKSLKWYWREKTYNMKENDVFKNYTIKLKDNFHIELIPILENNQKYDSVLIWLYDGDFPEYFIDHLLEFNNFPPKVK
jgi:hypothetical protein